jgi:hypothetical protein
MQGKYLLDIVAIIKTSSSWYATTKEIPFNRKAMIMLYDDGTYGIDMTDLAQRKMFDVVFVDTLAEVFPKLMEIKEWRVEE